MKLNYAFSDEGLVVKENGTENVIPLKYNPNNGRIYLTLDKLREKVDAGHLKEDGSNFLLKKI